MSAHAELSSVATTLDDVLSRIDTILGDLPATERERLSPDLYEVQRSVGTARRRLGKVVDQPR